MNMRRLIAVLLTGLLLVACGAENLTPTEPPTERPSATPEPAPVVDVVPVETAVGIMLEMPVSETPQPVPTPSPTPTPQPPLYGITIGIDPGHQMRPNYATEPLGPNTDEQTEKCAAGTRGIVSNVYEYEVNLSVAKKLVPLLEAKGATVVLTRTANDVNLSGRERAEILNAAEVDLAILLHCNGADDTSVRGAFVLVPDRACTETFSENVRAATEIINAYCTASGIAVRKHNGVSYRSDLAGFNWCTRPILCLEMGHLSNESEDLLLTNGSFQDKMAVGILEGILAYFNSGATE